MEEYERLKKLVEAAEEDIQKASGLRVPQRVPGQARFPRR